MYDWIGVWTKPENEAPVMVNMVKRLPERGGLAVSRLGAGLYSASIGRRARLTVRRNARQLLPELTKREASGLSRRYMRNLAAALYEILAADRLLGEADSGMRRFTAIGESHLREALAKGRGAIVYTPHIGNFFYHYWYLTQKYDCLTVGTGGSPELRPLYEAFQRLGCKGLDYDRMPPLELLRETKRHLRRGGVLFLLGDFYRPAFPVCTMFGRQSRIPGGAAALALEEGVPVVRSVSIREGGRHVLRYWEPLDLGALYGRDNRTEAIQRLADWLEEMISAYPDQWFYWFDAHRRFDSSGTPPQPVRLRREKLS